jgi:(S)-2-hydroxyglutarate dehydrogenase
VAPRAYDCIVIGGGLVGLATARALQQRAAGLRLLVLEKEAGWARHQSGRNSGVIHSGIYYRPGSLKALHAREGARRLVQFCREHGVAHARCGKLIVATDPDELPRLRTLQERAAGNEVEARWLDPEGIRTIEPEANGIAALHVPAAGIADFTQVAAALAALLADSGADLRLGTRVLTLVESEDEITAETTSGAFTARFLINCAGLYSDRLLRSLGLETDASIIPFRGDYYRLRDDRAQLVRHLIYPVPDPRFPFLGVHFTRGIDGVVHCGPNAVLALHREGYARGAFSWGDVLDLARFPGTWRLAGRYWREGAGEVHRALRKAVFTRSLARLVPAVRSADLVPAPSGVRAQAVGRDGKLIDDFRIVRGRRSLHVVNAPSPAATASLSLAETIAQQADLPATTRVSVA